MTSDSTDSTVSDNHDLFEAVTRLDRLEQAWQRVRLNPGAAGGDRETVAAFDASAALRLVTLQRTLRDGSEEPGPIRHVDIPKPSGGVRPLAIPCVVDRVAQTAVAMTLDPVLDPDFTDVSIRVQYRRSFRLGDQNPFCQRMNSCAIPRAPKMAIVGSGLWSHQPGCNATI